MGFKANATAFVREFNALCERHGTVLYIPRKRGRPAVVMSDPEETAAFLDWFNERGIVIEGPNYKDHIGKDDDD